MGIISSIKNMLGADKPPEPRPTPTFSPQLYREALEAERAAKDGFMARSAYGPIEDKAAFQGLSYFPPDPAYRLTVPFQAVEPEPLVMQTSTEDEQTYTKAGYVEFNLHGQTSKLYLYQMEGQPDYFLPFRDSTSGHETYGGGRYLEPSEVGGGQVLLDFNQAYNPYCAYSPYFSCPIPPRENWLTIPIRAGEKNYQPQGAST